MSMRWFTLCMIASCFGAIGMVVAGAMPFGWQWFAIEFATWGGCAYFGWHAHQVMKEMDV